MKRMTCAPRPNWQERVEEVGLTWHGEDDPYWNESAYYLFTAKQVDQIEAATNELHGMCLKAVQHVIDNKLYSKLDIPDLAIPLIENSWEKEPPSLYGRFDLAYDGVHPPKMLEYNADTPTSLLEAAVVQWHWLQDSFPQGDQFNSIHERLVATWKEFRPYVDGRLIHFCSLDDREDGITLAYLEDTAQQAEYDTAALPVDQIGWHKEREEFVGEEEEPIKTIFKLYPWEWLVREPFAAHLGPTKDKTQWIEPAWKMVLSNKGILPVLWDLYSDHPNLLPAYFDEPRGLRNWVSKPLLSREGANVVVHSDTVNLETEGDYGDGPRVYQQFVSTADEQGNYAVLGSWIIGQEAGGMGIRESRTPVTSNTSQFVPHRFE